MTEPYQEVVFRPVVDHILDTRNWSQRDLARKLGVTQPAVSRIRSGSNQPSFRIGHRLLCLAAER